MRNTRDSAEDRSPGRSARWLATPSGKLLLPAAITTVIVLVFLSIVSAIS